MTLVPIIFSSQTGECGSKGDNSRQYPPAIILPPIFSRLPVAELSEEDAVDEYESVVIPIYEELLVGCLTNIMSDVSNSDLARTYGQLMASGDDVAVCLFDYVSD